MIVVPRGEFGSQGSRIDSVPGISRGSWASSAVGFGALFLAEWLLTLVLQPSWQCYELLWSHLIDCLAA